MAAPAPTTTAKPLHEYAEEAGLALGITALAALTSPVSQLTLSPVFGAIPSSINHKAALTITFLLGFLIHSSTRDAKSGHSRMRVWLPLLAAVVPGLQYFVLQLSDQLGIVGGPILAGLVSCHSIVICSAFVIAEILDSLDIGSLSSSIPPAMVSATIALLPFTLLERFSAQQLPDVITHSNIIIPADVQLVVSAAYTLLCAPAPTLTVMTWSILIVTYLVNPHGNGPYADTFLNASLARSDWSLLARQWSTTGYVSVLESRANDYRVLRCDHSLLGGEWLLNQERRSQGWTGNEPIYSVFTMLEAVRLLERDSMPADTEAKALVVGLGVGTAPRALLQHGIETTIVELDPVVHDYASRFFDLPANHTAVIQDAVTWSIQQASRDEFERPQFDYIIHDVFTGGVEPLDLFTSAFLENLRALLSPDGAAAINYAGDLSMPLTQVVLNTIDLAFDRQCEIYSDDAVSSDGSVESFSNFIVFCRNSPGPITFRKPTSKDYLGSMSKKSYLLPRAEQKLTKTSWMSENVLHTNDINSWRKTQEKTAMQHWKVMRTVLPARVWELY